MRPGLPFALIALWAAGAASAQTADSPRLQLTRAWVAAAIQHTPGEADAAVAQVRAWNRAELDDLRDHVQSIVTLMRAPSTSFFVRQFDKFRGYAVARPIGYSRPELEAMRAIARDAQMRADERQLLRRGAMLHTDIAMLRPPDLAPGSINANPALQQMTVQLSDGRTVGRGDAVGHWELARGFVEASVPTRIRTGEPVPDDFIRLWYRAVGRFMLREGKLWLPHFDRALQLFDNDADLRFLSGSLHETLAAPRIQDAIEATDFVRVGIDRLGRPQRLETGVRSRSIELREAESQFRRALAADPALVEARVRLGHVLTRLDRPADAVKELRAVKTDGADRALDYFAALFLGRAAEAARDLPLAREAYSAAARLYPRAQSPRLALNQIAQEARVVPELHRVLAMPADESRDDPWWLYHVAAGRDADAVFAQLHALLLAGDRR